MLNLFLLQISDIVKIMTDKELIEALGGPAKVARHLGYQGQKGICRVSMWKVRGIPAKVKLENLGYFLTPLKKVKTLTLGNRYA